MKGFGIYVKNDLLEGKHVEAMGKAVWLYMWLLDHMTSIDEEGVGLVLGGKPIKYEEVARDLEISRDVYTEWMSKLETYPYIIKTLAPNGIRFQVLKATKRFRQNPEAGSGKTPKQVPTKSRTHYYKTVDKTVDTAPQSDANIPIIIDLFKEVNPSYQRLFGNPPQRAATERLLKQHGVEKLTSMISYLPKSNAAKYAPTITTPVQFEQKLGELIAWSQKQKEVKKTTVAFV